MNRTFVVPALVAAVIAGAASLPSHAARAATSIAPCPTSATMANAPLAGQDGGS